MAYSWLTHVQISITTSTAHPCGPGKFKSTCTCVLRLAFPITTATPLWSWFWRCSMIMVLVVKVWNKIIKLVQWLLVICKWCWRRVKATLKAITYYKWNHQKTNKGTKTFLSKAPLDYLLEDPQPLFLKVMFSLLYFASLLLLQMRNHYQFCNL